MSMPIGVKTERTSFVRRRPGRGFKGVRISIEQDWVLHPTKGWKRGAKRKLVENLNAFNRLPGGVFTIVSWKDWRR